jgi:hypothetical protein
MLFEHTKAQEEAEYYEFSSACSVLSAHNVVGEQVSTSWVKCKGTTMCSDTKTGFQLYK